MGETDALRLIKTDPFGGGLMDSIWLHHQCFNHVARIPAAKVKATMDRKTASALPTHIGNTVSRLSQIPDVRVRTNALMMKATAIPQHTTSKVTSRSQSLSGG